MKTTTITLCEQEFNTLLKVLDGLNDVQIIEQLQIDAGDFDLMYQAVTKDHGPWQEERR